MSSEHTVKNLFANQTPKPLIVESPSVKPMFPQGGGTVPTKGNQEPKTILGNLTPKGEKPSGPKSILSGATIRKRIEATIEQLRKYNEPDNVLKIAQQQIRETNVDELCLKYVLDWGADLQKKHALHLEEMISISTSPVLTEVKTKMGSLIQLMGGIDVENATKDSLFKSKEKKVAKLLEVLKELKGEASNLSVDVVMNLHQNGTELKKNFQGLSSSINPFIVTCSFFSEYEKDDFPKELYITRLSSLLSTKMALGNDVKTMDALLETIVRIVDVVNNIIRNELPTWISNLSAVLAGNVSDITTIQTNQNNITSKLKSIL